MSATPELDTAIRAGCCWGPSKCLVEGGKCTRTLCNGDFEPVARALRSLASPTPEVIEVMAIGIRRNQFERTRRHSFDETVPPTEAELNNARAAHAALWAHILGDVK